MSDRRIAVYVFRPERERVPDDQLVHLQKYALPLGERVEWYRDLGPREGPMRPAYIGFLEDLRRGSIDCLVVWRLDKLGLAGGGLAELFGELGQHNAAFCSLQDQLVCGPALLDQVGPVLVGVDLAERRLAGQAITEGCARSRSAGKEWGGSEAGRNPRVTEEQRAHVLALDVAGRPKAYIAKATGLSRPTVYRIIAIAKRGAS